MDGFLITACVAVSIILVTSIFIVANKVKLLKKDRASLQEQFHTLNSLLDEERTGRDKDAYVFNERIDALLERVSIYDASSKELAVKVLDEVSASKQIVKEAAKIEEKYSSLVLKYGEISILNEQLCREVDKWKNKSDTNLSHRKSSETRTGKLVEKFSPFMKSFPYTSEQCVFVGQPIDIIAFTEDKVVFVEVKSGKSHMSSKQKNIKQLIDAGKVEFEVFRVDYDDEVN